MSGFVLGFGNSVQDHIAEEMASRQEDRSELDAKARQGETVVPGGTGGGSLEAQEHLAEGWISFFRFFYTSIFFISIGFLKLC